MTKKVNPGGKGPSGPAKTRAPIVVPSGKKHPPRNPVTRLIREFAPTSPAVPTGSRTPEAPSRAQSEQGSQAVAPPKIPAPRPEPVQRATLQMLPGRLEPIDPEALKQEIRFIRAPSTEQVVTIGWAIGEPPGHITLNHSSIKPLHARMTYRGGAWWIESLDSFEPVTVNGSVLAVSAPARRLAHGDQVRFGSIFFRFVFP